MEMTTTKTLVVFAIIFGCFAVLYPKIFHPMVLHIFGFGTQKPVNDDIHEMAKSISEVNRVPPHLRKGPGPARVLQEDITRHVREEIPGSFRPGPHPGLRAAAEMKKQAATTTGTGKGMMGVVLPMYAVGIVIYLIYTLTKVFGKKEEKKEDFLSNNPFNDIKYDASKKEFKYSDGQEDSEDEQTATKAKVQQRDLERLLLRADERNITEIEMRQLKARLMETEAQMSRILKAMETVSDKEDGEETVEEAEPKEPVSPRTVDSSPDMESYEIIDRDRAGTRAQMESPVEDVGPVGGSNAGVETKPGTDKQAQPKQAQPKQQPQEDMEAKQEEKEPCEQAETPADEECSGGVSVDAQTEAASKRAEPCTPTEEEAAPAAQVVEKIPQKKEAKPQEPRPDLRKRKQGKKARRDH